MKVTIKDFGVAMDIKRRGIELEVNHNGKQRGDLRVTMTGLTWCKGKKRREHGKFLTWDKFIGMMETQGRRPRRRS
jgi:hypothetical protein